MFAHRPVLALLADSLSPRTVRVIVTPAILRAVLSVPAQVAFARIVGLALTNPVHAHVVTRPDARLTAVADVSLVALAVERAVRVFALGLRVAVVQFQAALVHVGTLFVRPSRVRHAQDFRAFYVGAVEITFNASAWK